MGQTIKELKGKIIFKHETEADWEKSEYIPANGEQVLYDPDNVYRYSRVKYGNGVNMVRDLPFSAIDFISINASDEQQIFAQIFDYTGQNTDGQVVFLVSPEYDGFETETRPAGIVAFTFDSMNGDGQNIKILNGDAESLQGKIKCYYRSIEDEEGNYVDIYDLVSTISGTFTLLHNSINQKLVLTKKPISNVELGYMVASAEYLYLGDSSITEERANKLKDFAKTGVVNTAKQLQTVRVSAENEDHPAIFGIIRDSATSNVDGSVILSLSPVYDGQYGYGDPPAIIAIQVHSGTSGEACIDILSGDVNYWKPILKGTRVWDDINGGETWYFMVETACYVTLLSDGLWDHGDDVDGKFQLVSQVATSEITAGMTSIPVNYLYLGDPNITEDQAKILKDIVKTGSVLPSVSVYAYDEGGGVVDPHVFAQFALDEGVYAVTGSAIFSIDPIFDGGMGSYPGSAIINVTMDLYGSGACSIYIISGDDFWEGKIHLNSFVDTTPEGEPIDVYQLITDASCKATLLSDNGFGFKLVNESVGDYNSLADSSYLYLGDTLITNQKIKVLKDIANSGVKNPGKLVMGLFGKHSNSEADLLVSNGNFVTQMQAALNRSDIYEVILLPETYMPTELDPIIVPEGKTVSGIGRASIITYDFDAGASSANPMFVMKNNSCLKNLTVDANMNFRGLAVHIIEENVLVENCQIGMDNYSGAFGMKVDGRNCVIKGCEFMNEDGDIGFIGAADYCIVENCQLNSILFSATKTGGTFTIINNTFLGIAGNPFVGTVPCRAIFVGNVFNSGYDGTLSTYLMGDWILANNIGFDFDTSEQGQINVGSTYITESEAKVLKTAADSADFNTLLEGYVVSLSYQGGDEPLTLDEGTYIVTILEDDVIYTGMLTVDGTIASYLYYNLDKYIKYNYDQNTITAEMQNLDLTFRKIF